MNAESDRSIFCPTCRGRGKILRDECILISYTECETCRGTGKKFELQTGRIDVVKKHATTGRVLKMQLERIGYDVQVFSDIVSYVDQLDSPPGCILAGYIFEHGYVDSLFALLFDRGINVPVIVCTNMDIKQEDLPLETYALFANHANHVSKPLRETIMRAMHHTELPVSRGADGSLL